MAKPDGVKLESTGYVTSTATNKNRIITVKNYVTEQFSNKQVNKQITTDNNINNKINNIVGQNPTAYSSEKKTL